MGMKVQRMFPPSLFTGQGRRIDATHVLIAPLTHNPMIIISSVVGFYPQDDGDGNEPPLWRVLYDDGDEVRFVCLVVSCLLVLSWSCLDLVLSWSCLVLSCLVLFCLGLVLPCLGLVLSCLGLVLSCLVSHSHPS